MKEDVLSTRGGLCFPLNAFMKNLLEVLGYKVYYVVATIIEECHLMVVVQNLVKKGDKYMVDTGLGFPIFEPISLDFEDESPLYSCSFMQYRYKYRDGKLHQYINVKKHADAVLAPRQEGETDFRQFCIFDMTPRDESYIRGVMDRVYADVESKITPFHASLRIVAMSGPGLTAVAFKDLSVLQEDDSHCLAETKLASADEFVLKVGEYFPQLKELAKLAVKNVNLGV